MVSLEALWRPRSRWTVLISACWVEATAGITYVFSTYSSVLKTELSYDQRHINRLSVAKDLGDTVGLAAGFLCRVLPNWAILVVGALLILAGYGFLWLLTDHYIATLPFWLVCILMFMGTNGCTYLDTAALLACIPKFPSNKATTVGILKGFKGLCGAIFNQIYASFLAPDESSFILMVALGPAVVMVPLIFLMGPLSCTVNPESRDDNFIFRLLYAASLLLAAYMLTVTLVQDLCSVSNTANVVLTIILLLILLLPSPIPKIADGLCERQIKSDSHLKDPLLKSKDEGLDDGSTNKPSSASDLGGCSVSPTESQEEGSLRERKGGCSVSPTESQEEGSLRERKVAASHRKVTFETANMTLKKAFGSFNFWLLFLCIFFSLGSGTTAFNNLGQMGQSQGYKNTQVFVSMTNIWNFVGRLAGGYASEMSTRTYGHPRSLMLAIFQLTMAVGHVFYAMAWPGTIYLAVFLVAAGYGAHWAIFPTLLSELFGLQNFGVLYNFVNMASPMGSLIYSGFIAGPIYDWQARKQSSASSGDTTLTCEGTSCFEITFLIMAAVCVIGAALSMILAVRTRLLYAKA